MFSSDNMYDPLVHDPQSDGEKYVKRRAMIITSLLLVTAFIVAVSYSQFKRPETKGDFVFDGVTYICSPGMYIATEGCLYCPPGTKCETEDTPNPVDCPIGEYQPKKGKTSCDKAQPGYFVAAPRSTQQDPCPIGKYQDLEAQGSCNDAPEGHYVDAGMVPAHMAAPCQADTVQAQTGQSACEACPTGTHQPFVGQTKCMSNVNVPWATLVGFTDLGTLRHALDNHGCPDGIFIVKDNVVYDGMRDVQPCEISTSEIKLNFYSGHTSFEAISTLTVNSAGITCKTTAKNWDGSAAQNWDCNVWASFSAVKLIFSTGAASRTFKPMSSAASTVNSALKGGYAPPMKISFADGRVIILEDYQENSSTLAAGGYRLARWYRDGLGYNLGIFVDGANKCTVCQSDQTPMCAGAVDAGVVINVAKFGSSFKCTDDIQFAL